MWDILSFNKFITQDVLVLFYYIGAIIIPVVLLFFRSSLIQKISSINKLDKKIKNFMSSLSTVQKTVTLLSFLMMFLCMELCWRMMFEAMIGYFDMHDYLYKMSDYLMLRTNKNNAPL